MTGSGKWKSQVRGLLGAVALLAAGSAAFAADPLPEPPAELNGLPLLFRDDFQNGQSDRWEFSDSKAWKVTPQRSNYFLNQFQQSLIKTSVRSPYNRALVKKLIVSDVVLDVRLQSSARDYGHRDMCLYFGFQDMKHFYYVHFGKQADRNANQIFIVDDKDRVKISTETTTGTPWDNNWHHARVVRKVADGTILVYFDDMTKPAMRAVDKTFVWGQAGVGTFDDTGYFDDVLIYGVKTLPPVKKRVLVP